MRRRKVNNESKGSPLWMATFSDLMTLLLVFFILLFAFSEIDATKFRMIANSFKGIFDDQSTFILENPVSSPIELDKPPFGEDEKDENKTKDKEENEPLDELLTKIKKYLADYDLEGQILATREDRGVVLVLQENILFDSGRAVVKQQARPFLNKVADLIETLPNQVEVEGHTDSRRIIQPNQYISNWNLAGDRASNVVNYFIKEHLIPNKRFKIAGYADTQSIASNSTVEGRLKNRRVVIVILDDNKDSPNSD